MTKQDQIRAAIVDCYIEALKQLATDERPFTWEEWVCTDDDEDHVMDELGVEREEIDAVWVSEREEYPQMRYLAVERVEALALRRVASQVGAALEALKDGERLCYDDEGKARVEGAQEAFEWLQAAEDLEVIATTDALSGVLQIHGEGGFIRTWTSA